MLGALLFMFFISIPAIAATWTDQTNSGARSWTGVAMSSDGTKIIAADNTDTSAKLYRSTDSGATWSAVTNGGSAFAKRWRRVASSSDGTILLASEHTGALWYSINSGSNWTEVTAAGTGNTWTGVAMSADGSVMAAVANPSDFWVSTNTGSTWNNPTGLDSAAPVDIAVSSDGTKMAAVVFAGGAGIYTSSNSGTTWTERTTGLGTGSWPGFWASIAMSADGTKLVATRAFGDPIFTSTDSGLNWTQRASPPAGAWAGVASSSDGSRLIAAVNGGKVHLSTDSGATWTIQNDPGTTSWFESAISSDGRFSAVGGVSDIWTYSDPVIVAPTVTTQAASSLTITTATLNGNITATGNESATTRGFHLATTTYYNANGSTYDSGLTISASGTFSTGAYTGSATGLTCNTEYHYRAFATNTAGTGTGLDTTFTTSACPVAPTVTTTATPSSITSGTAIPAGNITATGGVSPTSRYIEYGLTTSYGSQSAADTGTFSTGAFTERIYGLTQGTTYHYRACATNTAGTGCGSDQTFTTLAAPGQPTSLGGTAGYTQVSLTWSAPASSGDYAISDYLIEYKTTAASIWVPFSHTASTATSAIVTGLTNGVSYDFRVSAVNYAGPGTASSTLARTPSSTPTAPNAPTALAGTASSGQVALTWTAPANTGGAAITDYLIEYKTISSGSWSTFVDGTSATASATVTGLTNGTAYNFRVSATNSVGTGTVSSSITVGVGSTTYLHIMSTGQSLSEGVASTPALSTTQPYNNKSLSSGPIAGLSAPLIPLVEGVVARESPVSGMANSLRASDSVLQRPIIAGTQGGGGLAYSVIKKGGSGDNYANGQTQASVAKTQTESAGAYYLPYAVTIVHGETDTSNGVTRSQYASYMAQMQADFENDWNTLTGRSDTIPLFLSQVGQSSIGTIAAGQLDAHRDNPGEVILVGPRYQLEYGADNLHLTNTGSKYMGELYAKVMKKVLIDGATWNPLMPTQVTNVGNIVTIGYNIPTGTLAIDTTNVAARTDYGFEFIQTGGSAITINSVELINSNTQVKITLSGTPDGTDPRIRYAWNCENHLDDAAYLTCGGPSNSGMRGGNIRDTDTTTSPSSAGTGLALYDWSVTFDEPLVDASVPAVPTSLSSTAGNAQVSLTWTAPTLNGGATLTDYIVEYKTRAASTWSTFADGTSATASATVTGLTNGTDYMFRVSGVNAIGRGAVSNMALSTPAAVPDAPTSLNATGGSGEVSLTWTAPASDGGSTLTDYIVEYKLSASAIWSTFSDGTSTTASTTVTGLSNGATYNFRVSAVNAIGTGSASSTATATTDSTTVPDAPTGLGATRGDTQVALSWTAPASNGGSAITDYVVEYNDGGGWSTFADGTSTSTSATVTGLTNGTSYDFRVSATNAIGTGSASSTATATPATTPGIPTSLAAVAASGQTALTWTAPASTGGAAITDYIVEYKLSSDSSWSTFADGTSATASATVTGLTNGLEYNFRVSATNAVGTGSVSSTASAVYVIVPDAPTALSGTVGINQVSLSWSAPASNGGAAITDYVVEYKLSASGSWSTFADGTSTSTSVTITGLTGGSSYDFRVSATNTAGTGSVSGTATGTPTVTASSGRGYLSFIPVPIKIITPSTGTTVTANTYISPIDAKVRACPAATSNVRLGVKNNTEQVKLWQAFLNKELKLNIPLTGFYGPMTYAATKQFQLAHKNEILTPNGLMNPTGYIATSTRAVANKLLGCGV